MKMTLLKAPRACALFIALWALVTAAAASPAPLTDSQARAIVAPFYQALNAASDGDVPTLVMQAMSPEWLSCGGNDTCRPRDKVIGSIVGLHKAVPNLTWEIKELLVAGNDVIVRGEAHGTPIGELMGVPHGGKSFTLMSIDVHTVDGGKVVRSYHVEDWMGATRQLSAK